MPKLPPLSGREVISILEAHGYERKRQRGSHVIMRNGPSVCVVPDHKELKTGTLAGILRQAGVAPQTFAEWVNQSRNRS
jgi:predicted RNA binding protein YcfA (HicA-like mRNA interferase family)